MKECVGKAFKSCRWVVEVVYIECICYCLVSVLVALVFISLIVIIITIVVTSGIKTQQTKWMN